MDDVEAMMQEHDKIADQILEIVKGSSMATIVSTCYALQKGVAKFYQVDEEKSTEFLMRQMIEFVRFLDKEGKQKESK